MKYYRMSYEEVVAKRSYQNILLLNASIPSYKSKSDKDKKRNGKGKTEHPNEFLDRFI